MALQVRGRSQFELADAAAALATFEAAREIAPDDQMLEVWTEASRMIAETGEARVQSDRGLDSLGRQAKSKAARYAHGISLSRTGNRELAKDKLTLSLDGITEEYPNPLAYRSHVALARLLGIGGSAEDRKPALEHLEQSLQINPGYLPARDLMGQLLADIDPEGALLHLGDVIDAGVASAGAELAFARALAPYEDSERALAVDAIKRGIAKGASQEAVAALLEAVADEALTAAVSGAGGAVEEPEPKRRRRRRR